MLFFSSVTMIGAVSRCATVFTECYSLTDKIKAFRILVKLSSNHLVWLDNSGYKCLRFFYTDKTSMYKHLLNCRFLMISK